jgi:protein arginine N-methyltransferase 3
MDGEFDPGNADQGYALLYESMLDSVLYARDHFMQPGGLMAPSQTTMKLVGITGDRLWKERIEFWQSVYGFDMTAMDKVYFDEGLVEVVDASEIVTDDAVVRVSSTATLLIEHRHTLGNT